MPGPTRTIKIKFDGSSKGLALAAAKAGKEIDSVQRKANNFGSQAGQGMASGLLDALGALPSQLKGAAIVAAAGIGVVMAPALAAAIVSGVLLAVGGGVLAAGIVGAAKDPKVIRAWKRFGDQAAKTFERFSKPFVAPLVRAANTFREALKKAEPTILAIGRVMAPIVDKLAPALAGMAQNFLPGILSAAQASAPLFETLAKHAPGLGKAVSGFFDAIAKGMPAAQVWFDNFLSWVEKMLPKLGGFIAWVAELGPKMTEFSNTHLGPLKDAFKSVGDYIGEGLRKAFTDLKQWVADNKDEIKRFTEQVAGFIKDTGPALKVIIIGLAEAFKFGGTNVMMFVDALDRLKRWYNSNAGWLNPFLRIAQTQLGDRKMVPNISERAEGGPVRARRDYLVGEDGPEILRMGARGGTVIPNDQLGGGERGGWGDITAEIHIHIGDEVERVVYHTIRERDRGLKRAVLAGAGAR